MPDINEENRDEFLIKNFLKIIKRQKSFAIKIYLISLSLILCFSFIQRRINPLYKATTTLLIRDPFEASLNDSINKPGERSTLSNEFINLTFNNREINVPTLVVLLKSRKILQPVIDKYNLSYRNLIRDLEITSGGDGGNFKEEASGVLDIKLSFVDKQKTEDILNDISKLYLSLSLENRQKYLSDGLSFLNKELPKITQKTNIIQKKISNFRTKNFIVVPKEKALSINLREKKLDEDIFNLIDERERLKKIKKEIETGEITAIAFQQAINKYKSNYSSFFGEGLSITNADKNLIKKIIELEEQLSDAKVLFTKDSEIIRSLEKQLDILGPNFYDAQIKSVEAALTLNKENISILNEQKEILRKEFSKLPDLIMEYDSLEQELQIAQDNLSRLVIAKESFMLELSQNKIPWQVISPVYIEDSNNKSFFGYSFLLAIISSAIISLFAGYLKDDFELTIQDEDDIKLGINLPILSRIPLIKGDDIYEKLNNYFSLSENSEFNKNKFFDYEPFSEIVTSLKFLNDQKVKIISISSFLSSEGKTLINILLAQTLNIMGYRVLLVDFNFRNPKIHKIFSLKNKLGSSNVLSGESINFDELCNEFKDKNQNSFKIITSGTKLNNPIKLLNSKELTNFCTDLRNNENFDYIIFDTPAINQVSDFNLIAEYCDKLILLIALNKLLKKINLKNSVKFKKIRSKFIGIILNLKYLSKNN